MRRFSDVLLIILGIAFVSLGLNVAREGVDLADWSMRVASASVLVVTFVATLKAAIRSGPRLTRSEGPATIWGYLGLGIAATVLMRTFGEVGVREIVFWLAAVVMAGMVAAVAVAMVLGYPKDSEERRSDDRTTSS